MIIPTYTQRRFACYKRMFRPVLCYKENVPAYYYYCYLLPVTKYLATKLSITLTYNTCRVYLAENRMSFPSAPGSVRHYYLSKGLILINYTCGSLVLFRNDCISRSSCIHHVLMLCFGSLLKRGPNILVSSWTQLPRVGRTKDFMQVLIIRTYDYIWNTCLHYIDELELLCIAPSCVCYMMNIRQHKYRSLIQCLCFSHIDLC